MEDAMSRTLLPLSLSAALMGGTAFAEVPRVAVDIAPVHSLVARVMDGVGTPDLIVQPGGSPHEYSLRPSEAEALQEADLVFWVSLELTPWLGDAIETLATGASVTELLEADGTIELDSRESALFEAHQDGEDEDVYAEHADEQGESQGHGEHDTHAWLSPQNAATWLYVIAGQLSAADPENEGVYFANAAAGQAEIGALTADINTMLEPVRGGQFIVFHDAYQYFESAFEFTAAGAISIGDASDPSPARIAEIRARIAYEGIDCVLAEPQFNAGLVATVLDGTQAKTGVLDPLGSDLEPGPALYPQLIRNVATVLVECL
ncbi:MAG: zinc ABC transporter substrate-binding protein [Flavimaricola sp.]|nr:zinc ABC transporter substrate-binding protein [Flavimaricola sp.]